MQIIDFQLIAKITDSTPILATNAENIKVSAFFRSGAATKSAQNARFLVDLLRTSKNETK